MNTTDQRQLERPVSRRAFLQGAAAAAAWATAFGSRAADQAAAQPLRIGVVTDVHYADADARGTRHYRDSMAKLSQAVATFNDLNVDLVIELGDLIDSGRTKAEELEHLRVINSVYRRFHGDRHYVLGNHCLHGLTKDEFLDACGARVKRSVYSFDRGGWHFVVLDANYRRDGSSYAAGNFTWTDTWIPQPQQAWLKRDLAKAKGRKAVVFLHQNLDNEQDPHGVKNAPEIRGILEAAGNVVAVVQGHKHPGGYARIGGIHYLTLRAMVEGPGLDNNAYGLLVLDPDRPRKLEGLGRQADVSLP